MTRTASGEEKEKWEIVLEEQIKDVIYRLSRKGGMCEDFKEGQIIGLKTGENGELSDVAEAIVKIFKIVLEKVSGDNK